MGAERGNGMDKAKGIGKTVFAVIVLGAILGLVVYVVSSYIKVLGNVLIVMIGFGAVILVHEFGHFVFAKFSDINVEAFSIGFPPTLAGIKRTAEGYRVRILPDIFDRKKAGEEKESEGGAGFTFGRKGKEWETEYRIGLIPVGGFVKMLGQEDVGSADTSDDPRSYPNKKVGTRAWVIAAGVLFNVLSAVVIFMVTFLIGIKLPPPVVGDVMSGSPAAEAGIEAGDEVIAINGKSKDLDFSNIAIAAALSDKGEKVRLKVRKANGETKVFALEAADIDGMRLKGFGVLEAQSLKVARPAVGEDANELYEETGLRGGDRIKSVDGKSVGRYWEFSGIVEDTFGREVSVTVERDGKEVESTLELSMGVAESYEANSVGELYHICGIVPRLRVSYVVSNSPADAGGLKAGDIILEAGEFERPTYIELREALREHENKELAVEVLRGGEEVIETVIKPERGEYSERVIMGVGLDLDAGHSVVAETLDDEGFSFHPAIPSGARIEKVNGEDVSSFYEVIRQVKHYKDERITFDWRVDEEVAGVSGLSVNEGEQLIDARSVLSDKILFEPLKRLYKADGPVHAVVMGYRKTLTFVGQTYATIKSIIVGRVKLKDLMGPVGIITVSYRVVAHQPLIYYAYLLGLISACIAVFNFLPIPPLDGGQVAMLVAEKIKGSPVSERTQAIFSYAGWVLIGALFIYITFNDILRSSGG